VPTFVGLNFYGNHTVADDPAIRLSTRWMRPRGKGVIDNRATEAARGVAAERWCVEDVVRHGYGLATIYCGDLAPDDPGRVDELLEEVKMYAGVSQVSSLKAEDESEV
jgi:hypothetical protein